MEKNERGYEEESLKEGLTRDEFLTLIRLILYQRSNQINNLYPNLWPLKS